MATTLSTVRTAVRADLMDESSVLWANDEIDRAIARTVAEYSKASPRERTTTLTLTTGSRTVDLTAAPNELTDMIDVVSVEWPVSQWPRHFVRFGLFAGVLTLLVDTAPTAGQMTAACSWLCLHTLDGSSSTIPTVDEGLVATGAVAYAALQYASKAINSLNTGGDKAAGLYAALGQERLAMFQRGLAKLASRVRVRTLYVPATLEKSQTTDPGPGWD